MDARKRVVEEALTWLKTPYHSNAMVKGVGVDCATLLVGVYGAVGLLPEGFDPRPYPTQWHLHQNEERYMNIVLRFAHEVAEPSGPGDIVLFKTGRVYAHGGIILDWPNIIHAKSHCPCTLDNVLRDTIGTHCLARLPQKFFSMW